MDLTSQQRMTILAAFLGWMLDAFDFFLLTFFAQSIAERVRRRGAGRRLRPVLDVGDAVRRRVYFRPAGRQVGTQAGADAGHSLLFDPGRACGFLAESHNLPDPPRVSLASPWAANGALAARPRWNPIPPQARGLVSGILQCGYPTGFLLAAIAYGVLYGRTFGDYTIGWRAMFLLSVPSAFLVLFIRSGVPASASLRVVESTCEAAAMGDDHPA